MTAANATLAHLSDTDAAEIGRRFDAIRERVVASRGAVDAAYIRKVIAVQRGLETGGRATLLVSVLPPAWLAGTAMLSVSKILENMEIGHNVLHGQWDWMRDPAIHSTTWEWDNATPAAEWKKSHNDSHHVWTNVVGKDRDVGYSILRMSEDQRWSPYHFTQLGAYAVLATFFEYGIALYDIEVEKVRRGTKPWSAAKHNVSAVWRKVRPQALKDYVMWPLLSGPSAVTTFTANFTANVARNIWSNVIIFCGHFPDGAEHFTLADIEDETRGDWYLRQLLGSANIEGSPLFHVMTGNLSHQIEHHLFPDLPSNRYSEIAPEVRAICEEFGLPYTTGRLSKQYGQVLLRIARLSLPPREAVPAREPKQAKATVAA